MLTFLKHKLIALKSDSLYANSIYLMASTAIMSILGFLFWMICSRLYTSAEVGLATTLISVAGLITSFSLFGLNIGLIRYLPKSERKNDKINTVVTIVCFTTSLISIAYLMLIPRFSPQLSLVMNNPLRGGNWSLKIIFVWFMVFSSLSLIVESVFIAYRSSKFVLVKSTLFSLIKMGLPILFIGFGAFGLFSSYMVSTLIVVLISGVILATKFGYSFKPSINGSIVAKIGRFSFGNYLAGFIGNIPALSLPVLITNYLGPSSSAHYYMAMMIANIIFIIPSAVTQSLFAEGSHNEEGMREHTKKAALIVSVLILPAIIITIFFGKYILVLFGKEYSLEGFGFLRILALSSIFVSFNSIAATLFRINHRIKALIGIGSVFAVVVMGMAYIFMSKGLIGIGLSWIIGQALVSVIYLLVMPRRHYEVS